MTVSLPRRRARLPAAFVFLLVAPVPAVRLPAAAGPQDPPGALPPALLLAAHGVDERTFALAGGDAADGPAILWRTTDGGRTWQVPAMPVVAARLYDVRFVDRELGYACGLHATLLRTTDGGASWQRVPLPLADAWLAAVHFVDERTGVLAGASDGPLLLRTTDGGATWSRCVVPGAAAGPRGARPGPDGRPAPEAHDAGDVRDVTFVDPRTGFACGSDGLLLRTTDGGATWTRRASGSTAWLRHLSFPDPRTGFVACGDGRVLATTDGGDTFEGRGSVGGKANGIAFRDAQVGLVATMDGVLLRTADGGRTFTPLRRETAELVDVAALGGRFLVVGGRGRCFWTD